MSPLTHSVFYTAYEIINTLDWQEYTRTEDHPRDTV